ncbi:uncharacterized protein NECHADRAFT_85942 [Fusarium vanettenii 77-13-4]|uniref:Uncharacterized protein n=1 Tax=Fusarium vanettenii (strain ATCC MYA-4622 / CBS 123669 / FGSC 9596 / NRRL 45880 / 77-13-4) TaxID=660122 RepID=C7Z1W8_FUSV7|nr:uncharacterized protein NECHADRAFT_85942 [Fusarium vanettenii 77-13-4]EEU41898.1 predicted protein [Fusarium vanettenii 77-13-4]
MSFARWTKIAATVKGPSRNKETDPIDGCSLTRTFNVEWQKDFRKRNHSACVLEVTETLYLLLFALCLPVPSRQGLKQPVNAADMLENAPKIDLMTREISHQFILELDETYCFPS